MPDRHWSPGTDDAKVRNRAPSMRGPREAYWEVIGRGLVFVMRRLFEREEAEAIVAVRARRLAKLVVRR